MSDREREEEEEREREIYCLDFHANVISGMFVEIFCVVCCIANT